MKLSWVNVKFFFTKLWLTFHFKHKLNTSLENHIVSNCHNLTRNFVEPSWISMNETVMDIKHVRFLIYDVFTIGTFISRFFYRKSLFLSQDNRPGFLNQGSVERVRVTQLSPCKLPNCKAMTGVHIRKWTVQGWTKLKGSETPALES